MMKKILLIIFLLSFSFAQGAIVHCPKPPCTWQDFAQTIDNLMREIVIIAFWGAFLAVAIGAFAWMFGGPFPKWYEFGKNLIWTAIWFYIAILSAGIIFDIILEFFSPEFKTTSYFGPKIVLAKAALTPETFYSPLRDAVSSTLKCGKNPEKITGIPSLDKLFACIFEIIDLLKNVALILLVFAIIVSAGYIITVPIFGFKQISTAKKILLWSIIGLVIILLADVIKAQIEKILK
jgi:hypothetical protein